MPLPKLAFTQSDADLAHGEGGCNCGPAAFAAILGKKLDDTRIIFDGVGFRDKGYTSPTMMKLALEKLGKKFSPYAFPRVVAGRSLNNHRSPACSLPDHGQRKA